MAKEQQCRPTYFKHTDYSTNYHRSAHLAKKFLSRRQSEYKIQRGTVYRKYPSLAKNRDGECSLMQHHARIRCIQKVAHFSFHTCFGGKAGKVRNTIDRADKNTRSGKKYKQRQYRQSISLQKKRNSIIKVFPYRTACFGRLTTLSSLAACQLVVSQTPRGWRLVTCLRCCCRPSRLLVELAAEYTPPWIVPKYTPAPGLCNLNSKTHPYWLQTRNFRPRVLTPY